MQSFKNFINEAKVIRAIGVDGNGNQFVFGTRDGTPFMSHNRTPNSISNGMDSRALKANGTAEIKKAVKAAVSSAKDSKDLASRLNKISLWKWKAE